MVLQRGWSTTSARHRFCKAYANRREHRRDKDHIALDAMPVRLYVG